MFGVSFKKTLKLTTKYLTSADFVSLFSSEDKLGFVFIKEIFSCFSKGFRLMLGKNQTAATDSVCIFILLSRRH